MLTGVREWMKGKKTYFVGVLGILGAVVGFLSGDIDLAKMIEAIWMALAAMGIRAGISTEAGKTE
jgi:hypothetical protein